ncbi:hypothetical protein AMTR_s00095p00143600 [Amborella trichopoda]|uniref:Uncharacterized protein n=1 Tax=Amborella trichopoda TaxID=13333 RepID=W1NU89_AMBTC|nr:hypothetical protein AMTR_s00095p00143600 [Amborella trichopoda]
MIPKRSSNSVAGSITASLDNPELQNLNEMYSPNSMPIDPPASSQQVSPHAPYTVGFEKLDLKIPLFVSKDHPTLCRLNNCIT